MSYKMPHPIFFVSQPSQHTPYPLLSYSPHKKPYPMFTLLLSLYFGKLRALHKPSQPGWWSENNGNNDNILCNNSKLSSHYRNRQKIFPERNQSEVH